ncbi:MAG: hypothetical protein IT325_09885 [Anaerolineae bacterium]|nr:hypothetical protein [Anaerolineae bacterium]
MNAPIHLQALADPYATKTLTVLRDVVLAGDLDLLEDVMLEQPDQAPCDVVHRFGPGVYIRELTMLAGTMAIGHHQRFRHVNIVLKGRVTVVDADGGLREIVAPHFFVGEPGRKVGYVHEDTVWQNIYATTETDVGRLEAMLLRQSPMFLRHQQRRAAIALTHEADRQDFESVLTETGIGAEQAAAETENEDDQIPFPDGSYAVRVAASPIHGQGLFATSTLQAGDLIAPALIDGRRTPAGRFTNQSVTPNALMLPRPNGDIDLVALAPIEGMRGGQLGDEITIDYRVALALQDHLRLAPPSEVTV